MKVLILSARFPWPPFSGDRLRGKIWIEALSGTADVTLICPDGEVPPDVPPFRFRPVNRSLAALARATVRVAAESLPYQALLSAPYAWTAAIERARREAGEFDTIIVLLSRLDPWVRSSLGGARIVLDAIDSLRRNTEERARQANPLLRWLWRREARRVARSEADVAGVYDHVLVVSEDEVEEFGPRARAISSGVSISPLEPHERGFDFGFWGRLSYFANADAVEWLLDDIWPRIRALRPGATLVVAGADPTARIRAKALVDGVTLLCPVRDIRTLARNVRVALLPIRFGSGQLSKSMEAAEAGCAIVGTPQAFRGAALLAAAARIASSPSELAEAAVALLEDDAQTSALAARLRSTVVSDFARETALARLAAIAAGSA
jgi:polysaccharide biosynthesis protein PslH